MAAAISLIAVQSATNASLRGPDPSWALQGQFRSLAQ